MFVIFHSHIPSEIVKNYFFGEYFWYIIWTIALIPFAIENIKIHKKKKKYPKRYLTSKGKRSTRLFLDEGHAPAFVGMDLVTLFTIVVVLMIDVGIALPKDGFAEAYFFEKYFSLGVIPFISFVIYYLKTLRDESIPNRIINPWG